ncbi:TlpA family protein disulfide reductase [uncultured Friedmanniella sp.]|uniref:TlpA family protein disulfide reductase n=1 Tax=uncultured Friedmanniella sp. TaxID=335381 RepID=UPI0035C9B5C2
MTPLVRLTGALAAVLLVVGVSGCTTTGADEKTRSASQQGYVGSKDNLTRIAPADRKPVPVVSGTSLEGKPLSTADYPGKVVVVNVWGAWCPPCREEGPALQAASVATKGKAQFVGISSRDLAVTAPQAYVREHEITYPSIFDPNGTTLLTFAGTLPPTAIPSTLIIDAQGRLAARVLGSISEITLVDMVDDVAAGQ